MKQSSILTPSASHKRSTGTFAQQASSKSDFACALTAHQQRERVSFHTPGHKGLGKELSLANDVTELPGLDDLSKPTGVIKSIEEKAAQLWGSSQAFISVSGATGGMLAAMLAVKNRGRLVVIPRHAHRSVIQGLVLSGHFPVFYEPEWLSHWGIWGQSTAYAIAEAISQQTEPVAAVVVTSPTYAGIISNIHEIAPVCHQAAIPLIVDAAHGAHFNSSYKPELSAVAAGADIVVHSLHKTLSALTQTGMVQVTKSSLVDPALVRQALNLVLSSSPSYLMLSSIDEAVDAASASATRLNALSGRIAKLRESLANNYEFLFVPEHTDPLHLLFRSLTVEISQLAAALTEAGIYVEAALGCGLLALMGINSTEEDVAYLEQTLISIAATTGNQPALKHTPAPRPVAHEQMISPRKATFSKSMLIDATKAIGKIAAETMAPCPPGVPVMVAGQKISATHASSVAQVRVVID